MNDMLKSERWILPEGIRETLPPEAMAIELNRQSLLKMFHTWGYDLVDPPLIDFMDSLLTGTGHDLQLMTFSLTDQMSGKILGIRSDMTPQVARIDAHHIKHNLPTRFCYIGKVLHTRLEGFAQSRSPIQLGAEIYGHPGFESDLEIIQLMLTTLKTVGIEGVTLDLGHVCIFQSLSRQASLNKIEEQQLFDALQRKAVTEIKQQLQSLNVSPDLQEQILALVNLHGDVQVLEHACATYADNQEILKSLDDLKNISQQIQQMFPQVELFFDLAELRGFNYHTGVVFAAYLPGHGQAIALGGRYDGIGEAFGRSRAATGFSTDLEYLVSLSQVHRQHKQSLQANAIFAPVAEADMAAALEQKVMQLRQAGERVVRELRGQPLDYEIMGCKRKLVCQNKEWQVVDI